MQFLRYAARLPTYDGAVAATFRRLSAEPEQAVTPPPGLATQQPANVVEASPLNLQSHPLMREFIDYG